MKKDSRKFNRLKITLSIVLGTILLLCLIIYLIFFHEINTILSIKKINNLSVYEMNYQGDYALDKYLSSGSKDYFELADFLNENLLKGIPKYYYQQFECSSFYAKTPEGDYILARNYDTEETIPFILRTNSSDGYQTIGMANLINLGWSALELLEDNTTLGEAQWSVVYNLTKKTMSIEFFGDYENTYTNNIEKIVDVTLEWSMRCLTLKKN